ncbi:MAG: hypothetical protein SV422_05155 [Pseudomonadota bacterium]|nr:hypothetical protein [Pseudomonadota bacterium]
MSKSTRLANRKAAIFSATLLGTLLILAVALTNTPVQQQAETQQLANVSGETVGGEADSLN